MPKKNDNWKILSKRSATETMRNRDVFGTQQLERSKIEEKQRPTSRIVFSLIVALFAVALVYAVACGIDMLMANFDYSENHRDYYVQKSEYQTVVGDDGVSTYMEEVVYYYVIGDDGYVDESSVYYDLEDVPVPNWYIEQEQYFESIGYTDENLHNYEYWLWQFNFICIISALGGGLLVYAIMYTVMMRNLDAQNMMSDTSDINQYENDQHIALPEEIQQKFDWFPDVGAHSSVQVSSMISHMALTNKGLKKIDVAKRAEKDIVDENGNILYYKGEALRDDDGNVITCKQPMIDTKFMESLFDASSNPDEPDIRKYYDTTKIPYRPEAPSFAKVSDCKTVADLINKDWVFPEYEPQRPGGAYIVDTDPVNTMV